VMEIIFDKGYPAIGEDIVGSPSQLSGWRHQNVRIDVIAKSAAKKQSLLLRGERSSKGLQAVLDYLLSVVCLNELSEDHQRVVDPLQSMDIGRQQCDSASLCNLTEVLSVLLVEVPIPR